MRSVAISEFKATCLALIEQVRVSGEPIIITRRGVPVARVEPPGERVDAPMRRLGGMRGQLTYHGDIVGPVAAASDWDALQ